jgi:hypothetical protein
MTMWTLSLRMVRELAFTSRGLTWLLECSLVLSLLVYLFLTNGDLSLMDQKTMMFMTAQAIRPGWLWWTSPSPTWPSFQRAPGDSRWR